MPNGEVNPTRSSATKDVFSPVELFFFPSGNSKGPAPAALQDCAANLVSAVRNEFFPGEAPMRSTPGLCMQDSLVRAGRGSETYVKRGGAIRFDYVGNVGEKEIRMLYVDVCGSPEFVNRVDKFVDTYRK